MDLGLAGRKALVLGATSGLGLAIAQSLAREGAGVVLAGRRGEVAAAEAARLPGASGEQVDLVSAESVDALARRVTQAGAVDILVLNSGGPPPAPAHKVSPAAAAEAAAYLLFNQVRLVNLFLPAMRQAGWGRVLAIGSSGVQAPLPGLALSNTMRGGLAAYLKTLAAETAPDGVTVNMILPGRISSSRVAELDSARAAAEGATVDAVRRASQATIPMLRYGQPEEFAAVAAFLCGAPASYITGEQIRVDGGLVRSF